MGLFNKEEMKSNIKLMGCDIHIVKNNLIQTILEFSTKDIARKMHSKLIEEVEKVK